MTVYQKSFIASLEEDFRQVEELLAKLQDSNAALSYTQELAHLKASLDQLNLANKIPDLIADAIITPYAHSLYHSHANRNLHTLLSDDEAILSAALPPLTIPPRIFTLEDLAEHYNGKEGRPAYVAANGLVFDVTHSPAWRNGTHRTLEAGMNHSNYFTLYHNSNVHELSLRVPIMGRFLE